MPPRKAAKLSGLLKMTTPTSCVTFTVTKVECDPRADNAAFFKKCLSQSDRSVSFSIEVPSTHFATLSLSAIIASRQSSDELLLLKSSRTNYTKTCYAFKEYLRNGRLSRTKWLLQENAGERLILYLQSSVRESKCLLVSACASSHCLVTEENEACCEL